MSKICLIPVWNGSIIIMKVKMKSHQKKGNSLNNSKRGEWSSTWGEFYTRTVAFLKGSVVELNWRENWERNIFQAQSTAQHGVDARLLFGVREPRIGEPLDYDVQPDRKLCTAFYNCIVYRLNVWDVSDVSLLDTQQCHIFPAMATETVLVLQWKD